MDQSQNFVPDKENKNYEKKDSREREELLAFLRQDKPLLGLTQLTVSRLFLGINHVLGLCAIYYLIRGRYSWGVLLFEFIYSYAGAVGTTIGAHRLFTHKSFKAKTPLKILLMIFQTITVQYSIYKWCLDHRIHHKFTDTNKDPHNSKRGFWFSHITWTISKRHHEHLEKLKSFDMPDLERDPVVRFQSKYYVSLVFIFYGFIPIVIAKHIFEVVPWEAYCLNCLRWAYNLHISAAVNSFAHIWGDKPFDKEITSTDNKLVAVVSVGEGWHNYHHTFPWDYKASELGWKINFSTMLIDFFARIGWAYDLKIVTKEMILKKMEKSGDGSHPEWKEEKMKSCKFENRIVPEDKNNNGVMGNFANSKNTWGWNDDTVSEDFTKMTTILNPSRRTNEMMRCR